MHVLAPRGGPRAGGFDRGPSRAAAEVAPEGTTPTMPQPEMFAAGARATFGPDGAPTDADTREHLARSMGAFAAWMRRVGPAVEDRPRPAPPPESGGPARQP